MISTLDLIVAAFDAIWRLTGVIIDSGTGFERFYARFFIPINLLKTYLLFGLRHARAVIRLRRSQRRKSGTWCLVFGGLAKKLAERRPHNRVAHASRPLVGGLFTEALDLNGTYLSELLPVGLCYVLPGVVSLWGIRI